MQFFITTTTTTTTIQTYYSKKNEREEHVTFDSFFFKVLFVRIQGKKGWPFSLLRKDILRSPSCVAVVRDKKKHIQKKKEDDDEKRSFLLLEG